MLNFLVKHILFAKTYNLFNGIKRPHNIYSFVIPNLFHKEGFEKIGQLIDKNTYLYELCIRYISLITRYVNETIECIF